MDSDKWYGVTGCPCKVEQVDRHTQVVTCDKTPFEGIWSTLEPATLTDLWKEHYQAHERTRFLQDRAFERRQALHIYNTTEPGHPARRGIGQYL